MKAFFASLLALVWLVLSAFSFGHPIYISITRIDHNPETPGLEITVKIFTDDLEQVLEDQGTGRLMLGSESEAEKADVYIARYLNQRLKLQVNGQEVSYQYLGKEVELDVTWIYVEVLDIEMVQQLEVENRLLFELAEEQQNIIHLRAHGERKSLLLRAGNPSGQIALEK